MTVRARPRRRRPGPDRRGFLAGMAVLMVAAVGLAAAAAQEEAERRLKEYRNQRRQTLDNLAPVLVDSHRHETKPRARPDPRMAGVKAPSVRRGWVAERVGVPVVNCLINR